MSRGRIVAAALAWLYPLVFVAAAILLSLPEGNVTALLMIFLGPVAFAGVLSALVATGNDSYVRRCALASRRMAGMCKIGAIAVLIVFVAAILMAQSGWKVISEEAIPLLCVFLIISMTGFTLAAAFFRAKATDSLEPSGAKEAFYVTAVTAMLAFVFFPAVVPHAPQEHIRRRSCQTNLKQLGMIFTMFAEKHGGLYPELSSRPGFLSVDQQKSAVYPEYMNDIAVLTCPNEGHEPPEEFAGHEQERFDASSYAYLGYAVQNAEELQTFFDSYRERVVAGLGFDEDLPAPPGRGTGGGDKIVRLKCGSEKYQPPGITRVTFKDVEESKTPVLIERRPANHIPSGINILYLDGHVEFKKYPGAWPATPETFAVIEAIEAMRAPTQPARP